jgi:F-type H+-transporting ATPase subunit b
MIALSSILMAAPLAATPEKKQPAVSTLTSAEVNARPSLGNANKVPNANTAPGQSPKASLDASADPGAQFRNSASLKWMAHKLGVSTATAYGLSAVENFLLIIGAGVLLLCSRLPAFFRNRTQGIRQALDEARKTNAEALQRLSAIEERLAKLQIEIAALQSAADHESQAEGERIRAAAEEEKRKIMEAADQEINAAVSLAKREFRTYAADLAATLAANSIQVDACTDEALLRAFVDQLGRSGAN